MTRILIVSLMLIGSAVAFSMDCAIVYTNYYHSVNRHNDRFGNDAGMTSLFDMDTMSYLELYPSTNFPPIPVQFTEIQEIDHVEIIFPDSVIVNQGNLVLPEGVEMDIYKNKGKTNEEKSVRYLPVMGLSNRVTFNRFVTGDRIEFHVIRKTNSFSILQNVIVGNIRLFRLEEPLRITNLAKIQADYLAGKRRETMSNFLGMTGIIRRFKFLDTNDSVVTRWRTAGVPVDNLILSKDNTCTSIDLEFITNNNSSYEGTITAAISNSKVRNEIFRKKAFHFCNSIPIGEWRIDDNSYLYIKMGDGKWCRANKYWEFAGTELSNVTRISEFDFSR